MLDTLTGAVVRQLPAEDTLPHFSDMEEVAQDDHFFYFGDFGNNHEYLRDDLRVLRLAKDDLMAGIFHFDTIFFTYEGYDPTMEGGHELPVTDYDCEAMIATDDSLYLFTKQWSSQQTTCYALPNQPGCYTAHSHGSVDVEGLVTGACYRADQRLLVLVCYSLLCQPFVYLLYDFQGTDFFGGQSLRLPLINELGTQTEAIATADGLHYYLTNERLSRLGITHPAQLLSLDLTDYLDAYLHPDTTQVGVEPRPVNGERFVVTPNPATDYVEISALRSGAVTLLSLYNSRGQLIMEQTLQPHIDTYRLSVDKLPAGNYLIIITTADGENEGHIILVM